MDQFFHNDSKVPGLHKVFVHTTLSHSDSTVGFEMTPNLLSLAGFTAGREFHPALNVLSKTSWV